MQQPELRLVRYWVAVAEEANVTRAAERLHISQPALSAAIKQLEGQLGVALLERTGRGVTVTAAGAVLLERGRELLALADAVVGEVRARDAAAVGRLRIGMTPTARYGVGPALLAACADRAPGVMLYPQEDTTGALLRDVRSGRLDLAVLFCAGALDGVASRALADEPAVVHLRGDHPLAARAWVALEELAAETFLVAESAESGGFTARVLALCRARGFEPRVRPDPYPDLGLQAVREGLGVVVYVRGAFPALLPGSAFVPVAPAASFPFTLAWREGTRSGPVAAVLDALSG
jgi:DNA-binding transcriptional LysR family regulator